LEGGMLTMGDATSDAATTMVAGGEEGEELTRYIQILDGTVAGSSGTFEEMEQIFGRIVDQGHMTRNEFDMIAQRMPGFSKAVQDNMNVSSEEMYEMLRNGEITTDQFLDVMEDFSGEMAKEYAKTWDEMEQKFGRIVDQGHMTRNEFDMIAQRMPGFSKAVQDNMNVSSEEMYEMLRNGEITTDQFLDVMEDFSGEMAKEYAKTWDGMKQ